MTVLETTSATYFPQSRGIVIRLSRDWNDDPPIRGVFTREAAMALSEALIRFKTKAFPYWNAVSMRHVNTSIIKVANERVLGTYDADEIRINFPSEIGSGVGVNVSTNQLEQTMLERIVRETIAMAPIYPKPSGPIPEDPSTQHYRPHTHLPVALWHDTTTRGFSSIRRTTIPTMLERARTLQQTNGVNCVSTVGVVAIAELIRYEGGLTAWSQATDSELSVTARMPDNAGSGWSGAINRDWSRIVPGEVMDRAADIAVRTRGFVAYEPGRRTAILSAVAVGQLVRLLAPMFNADPTDGGQTPFSLLKGGKRKNRLGMRVVDPRLTLQSDPADPMGGFAPYLSEGLPGFPITPMTWIERGILQNLAYDTAYGTMRGKHWNELPRSVHLTTAPGTATQTVDEMIASCEHGIYVNRLSDVALLDRTTGMSTGVTRDGCFLVRHGKIEKPIKNFRFLDSPIFAFNRLMSVGVPERTPFGVKPSQGAATDWPFPPVIAPPMMIADFNFASMADAV